MRLLIVLQTHSKGDSQHYLKMHDLKRYCGADKPEVMRRCTASLVDAINYAKRTSPMEIELKVFDDHSDEQSIGYLKENLAKCEVPNDLEHLETFGIMPSILKCYEYGRDHGKDWVYFAQDDYLYDETAIEKMMLAALDFSKNLNRPVSIYPFNDPYKYEPVNVVVRSNIVRSSDRHWRTQIMTASCFMTHVSVIHREWDLFEKMGKSPVSGVMEDESINQLFRTRGHHLFVPIPSLALHMQYSTEYDPLMDWRSWWDKYDRGEQVQIDQTQKTVLNVGCGRSNIQTAMFADDLKEYREYRLDSDPNNHPDIVCSLPNLGVIPTASVSAVFASHVVEHLNFHDVMPAIKEMLRVAKEEVRILVPNLKALANKIAEGDLLGVLYQSSEGPVSVMDILYGHRPSTPKCSGMQHLCGFTKETFSTLLEGMDFSVEENDLNLVVKIKKPD